ncbi:hypothetical protein FAGAP_6084 [Fusarium agapanthi]|uniref:Uncharacterized protein n=1 Tax=Fusarium agapanthi TaxID=1803897 RepID=A0A9P5B9Q7_9HYPO|nr:hypothetical protein FAGAP_6084 [Fusarium agapanthi]
MNYNNEFFTVCILAFSTTVCILGLILGVVFIFFQRQRDEQLLDDIYHTEKTNSSSIARHSGSNKNSKIPIGGAYRRKLVTRINERQVMASGLISKLSPRSYQIPLDAYNSESIPSNSTMSNIEGELQQDESIPWGSLVFRILLCLFFLLTILRWADLQLNISRGFINSDRWRAYFGMEVPRQYGQSDLKKVGLGNSAPLIKEVVKKVRFYDDTTIVEDIERVEAKSNGVDYADQDETKRE